MVAEMETGEGQTLTATLPACTAALAGVSVHIAAVNDFLAARDAEWMAAIHPALGLTVGTIVHGMDPDERRAADRGSACHRETRTARGRGLHSAGQDSGSSC